MDMRHEQIIDHNMRARAGLYVAGAGAVSATLLAVTAVLDQLSLILTALALVLLGFVISWTVRHGKISNIVAGLSLLAMLAAVIAAFLIDPVFRHQIMPPQAGEDPAYVAIILLTWMVVVASYHLNTDTSIVFLCVPCLSLLGLLASFNPSMVMMTCFGLFLAFACFILLQHNALAEVEHSADGPMRFHAPSFKIQIGITASITLVALIIGSIGTLFYPSVSQYLTQRTPTLELAPVLQTQDQDEFIPVATGPAPSSEWELFTVRSDRRLLLRSRSFDKYTGQGWRNSVRLSADHLPRIQDYLGAGDRLTAYKVPENHPLIGERAATEPVEQTIKISSGFFRRLHAAAEPDVVIFRGRHTRPVRFNTGLEVDSLVGRDTEYTVISQVSRASPVQLMDASTEYPEIIMERYMSWPESCWPLQEIAQEVTRGKETPYERAVAIQNHLMNNYFYDSTAPLIHDEDPVVHFLFKSRRGYCDMFATSMVLLSRLAGIPARWVVGYSALEYDEFEAAYIVRVRDSHAWAELYFPGYGWITFDATPEAEITSWRTKLLFAWHLLSADRNTILGIIVLFILIGYLVKVEIVDRFRKRRRTEGSGVVTEQYLRMCRLLSKFGFPRDPAVTPHEYASCIRDAFPPNLGDVSSAVDSMTADFVEYRYGGYVLSEEKTKEMANLLNRLARRLKIARRQKLLPHQICQR